MKKLAVTLGLLATAASMSGCVIAPGPVVSQGKAQGLAPFDKNSSAELLRPKNISDPAELVRKYLNAAADWPETQLETLRSYMSDKDWKPNSGDINIYRVGTPSVSGQSGNTIPVSVPMQRIGVLRDHRIDPVFEEWDKTQFSVVDTGGDGYLLKNAPADLMMSDTMLSSAGWFEPAPLYFWDKAGTRLVPDMRYIPRYLKPEQRAKLLLEYLYKPGPSPWLVQGVNSPPNQVPLLAFPVYTTSGTVVIDLPNQLSQQDLPLFYAQLEKTLKPDQISGLQLKIKGVTVAAPGRAEPIQDYRSAARFAVQQKKVVRLESETAVGLPNAVNTNVDWVQFSRAEQSVALAQTEGGVQHFLIGPTAAPKEVTVAKGQSVDQAMWLGGEGKAALVLSDHKLYEVVPGEQAKVAQLAVPVSGAVMSFSVTPDGRIAMVIDNKLYVAVLYHNPDALVMTQPQQVPTALTRVQHVALGRDEIIVAGVGQNEGQTSLLLAHMYIDGSRQVVWKSYEPTQQISHLAIDYSTGAAFFDYNSAAQALSLSGASQIVKAAQPSPTPSATPPPPPPLVAAVSIEG